MKRCLSVALVIVALPLAASAYDLPVIAALTRDSAGKSEHPSISADGRFIAYKNHQGSGSTSLTRILVWDRTTAITRNVSVGLTAVSRPVMSRDGRHVAFFGSNDGRSGSPSPALPYIVDCSAANTSLQTPALLSTSILDANTISWPPAVSDVVNGRVVVVFKQLDVSYSTVKPIVALPPQILAWDTVAGTVVRVSRTSTAQYGNGASSEPVVDSSGTRVAFSTTASNLGVSSAGEKFIALSDFAGSWSVNQRVSVVTNSDCDSPTIDGLGRRVAYVKRSIGEPKTSDVYVRDLISGWNGIPYPDSPFRSEPNRLTFDPKLSPDGLCLVTTSFRRFGPPDFVLDDVYILEGVPETIVDLGTSLFVQSLPPIGASALTLSNPAIQSYSNDGVARHARSAGSGTISSLVGSSQRYLFMDSTADRILDRATYPGTSWIYQRKVY